MTTKKKIQTAQAAVAAQLDSILEAVQEHIDRLTQ